MKDCTLDVSKLTNEERELYKTYQEGLRDLRIKEIEEDVAELNKRWEAYKNGETASPKVYAINHNLKLILEDLQELDETLKDISELDSDEEMW